MTNYTMEGRTYRYFNGNPLYPFGYGLTYTNIMYAGLSVMPKIAKMSDELEVKVVVKNIGPVDSDEVWFVMKFYTPQTSF